MSAPHSHAPLFVSHGAPSLLLDGGGAADFLKGLGKSLERPRAIICMSAHWESPEVLFDSSLSPQTLHDFSGFPEAMYQMRYPAPGHPELAAQAAGLCKAAGLSAGATERGRDHGAWVPLMALFPEANIPVVQVSLPFAKGPRGVFEVGRALSPLQEEGVLLLASGGFVHNLREIDGSGGLPPAWAREFRDWAVAALREGRLEDLLEAETRAPHFSRSHPRAEHWMPLYFALGAAGAAWRCVTLYEGFDYGSLAMDAFAFRSTEGAVPV